MHRWTIACSAAPASRFRRSRSAPSPSATTASGAATELKDAQRQIDLCLDHGVNLIDTANVYNDGVSESIIGEALTDGRRDRMLVATKVRFSMGKGPNDRGLSRYHIIAQCEASLKRLKTDVIDLYQVHEWDGQTPLEETIEALDTLVKQGKVRYVGCSNYSAWHLMKALARRRRRALAALRLPADPLHAALGREAEYELVPLGLDQGVSHPRLVAARRRLARGKYTRNSAPESGRQQTGFREPPITTGTSCGTSSMSLNDVAKAHGVIGRAGRRSPGCCSARWSPR